MSFISPKETQSPFTIESSGGGDNSGGSRGALLREALALPTERGKYSTRVAFHVLILPFQPDAYEKQISLEVGSTITYNPFATVMTLTLASS